MNRSLALALAVVSLTGCLDRKPRSAADLEAPAYTWSIETGTCGEVHALDGYGVLWGEKGCESNSTGFRYERAASRETRAGIVAAFDALRSPAKQGDCPELTPVHRFESRVGDRAHIYRLCIRGGEHVPEPFAGVVRAFGGTP